MKKTFILCFVLMLSSIAVLAQQNDLPKYQRSALHMILLNTDEPALPSAIDFSKDISEAWESYPFPDKYDQHKIAFKEAYGGKPKGSFIELVNKYQNGFGDLSLAKLKEISSTIADNKYYNQQLIDTTTVMLKTQKVGQQLVAKWFDIKADAAAAAAQLAADAAYTATHLGYSAYTTTVLYKLDWNDSIQSVFNQCWTEDNKIDMQKFQAIDFPFELVGVQKTSSTTMDAKGGFANLVGVEGAKPQEELIKQTIIRNLDKTFAALQYNYDVFKPLVPIISIDPLLIDAGMKESIDDKSQFDLLEAQYNEKTKSIEYKSVGKLKVEKGKVWDNRYSLIEDPQAAEDNGGLKGTQLSANKKAALGMVVRQITKKKGK